MSWLELSVRVSRQKAALVDLVPALLESLGHGGELVLSGILEEQAEEVARAYAKHLTGIEKTIIDGWVLLTGRKPVMGTDGSTGHG